MREILSIVIEYIISYALVFFLYYLLFIRKKTKYNKKRVPVELYYLVNLYKLREKDINYKRFIYLTGIVNSFIIVTTYIVLFRLVDGWFWRFICGIVIIVLLIIICYGIIGRYYQKKQNIERR